MQKSIIDTLTIFSFDCDSMRAQWQVEKTRLQDFLSQRFTSQQAAEKYKTICNNIKSYITSQYNITL